MLPAAPILRSSSATTAASSAGESVSARRAKWPMLAVRSRQWSAADCGRSSSRITVPVASRPARRCSSTSSSSVAEAAEHPRERGPLGAERRRHGRARLPEPGVLLDRAPRPPSRPRPPGATTRADLAEHRLRIGGDHQREPAHGRRECTVPERERRRSCRRGATGRRAPARPARSRAAASRRLAHVDARDGGPGERPARRPASRCRSPRRAPWRRRRPRRGSRGSPAAAAGHCSLTPTRRRCTAPGRLRTAPGSPSSRSDTRRRPRRPSRRPAGSAPACRTPDRPPRRPPRRPALQASSAAECRHATSSARTATAISSWRSGPRSRPAGLRTRASAASSTPRSRRTSKTDAARRVLATSPTYPAPDASAAWSVSSSPRPIAAITTASGDAGDLAAHAPADGRGELAERAGGRAVADHRQERPGDARLEQHLDGALRRARRRDDDVGAVRVVIALRPDPHEPRLAGCERAQRLADHHGLRARSSHPAGDGCRRPGREPDRRAGSTPGGGRGRPSRARTARRRPRAARP